MKNRITSAQSGFTLVELIVVIIILAILGAVALPKFMDVTEKAYKSAVEGAVGGLGAGVALFHAQWVANGHTTSQADVAGFGDGTTDSNSDGWPVGAGDTAVADDADCVEVWNAVMQSPPTVIAQPATTADYTATSGKGSGANTTCTYDYNPDTGTARSIVYDSLTGNVTRTNP